MSSSPILHRSMVILLVVSASLVGVATPASASGTTRWVDDDGEAGSSDCEGTGSASTSIQGAINASGANDTVKVCPGTYLEKLTISGSRDGLTLTSVTSHAAIIRAKAEETLNTITLVKVTSVDDVTISGFSIQPLRDVTSDSCDWGNGITASGAKDLAITDNDIAPHGSGPFCGVSDGIALSGGTTGTVSGDTVTDYREEGIQLSGAGTAVTVDGNSVVFAHVGLSPSGGAAISVDSGAQGKIRNNTIKGPAAGPGNPPQPAAGIDLDHAAADTSVVSNTIKRMAADIRVYKTSSGTIRRNVMNGGQTGLDLLDGDKFSIHDNTSSTATVHGLGVGAGSKHDDVHDNDFRSTKNGNLLKDCQGDSGTGANNTWANNLGNTSSPSVLCHKPTTPIH